MLGYLVKCGLGGIVAYAAIKVLEQHKVFEKATEFVDQQLTKLVPDNLGFGSPNPEANPWRATSDGRL
jgi:hypothetical protein